MGIKIDNKIVAVNGDTHIFGKVGGHYELKNSKKCNMTPYSYAQTFKKFLIGNS